MQRLEFILYRAPHAAKLVGPACALLLGGFFVASGVLFPESIPAIFSSPDELLGQTLMLIVFPPLLLTYLLVAQRRSERGAIALASAGAISGDEPLRLRQLPRTMLAGGSIAGFLYGALLNVPYVWRSALPDLGRQELSIAFGQLLLWTLIGAVLAFRAHTAWWHHRVGKHVPIDIYDPHKLEPFARNGLDDAFGVAVLFSLSTLQSIDAQFRLDNYINATAVAIPAATCLLLMPMWSLHRRLAGTKRELLTSIHEQIAATERSWAAVPLAEFELLLQHRDRIRRASSWPVDFSLARRLVFYVFIPPLAWVAAALVEMAVGRALGAG